MSEIETSLRDIVVVYVTCADMDEARRIGRTLVDEKLAACVNLRQHEAIYRWEGNVEQGAEAGMIIKTTAAAYPALELRVRALHAYSVPCILAFTPVAGLQAYGDWIGDSVAIAGD